MVLWELYLPMSLFVLFYLPLCLHLHLFPVPSFPRLLIIVYIMFQLLCDATSSSVKVNIVVITVDS